MNNAKYLTAHWKHVLYCLAGVVFLVISPGRSYAVKLLFWILIGICAQQLFELYYKNLKDNNISNSGNKFINKDVFIIVFVGVLVFLPILSTPFYFQDEYWNYPGYVVDSEVIWSYGRIFQSLFGMMFSFLNPQNIYIGRWFTVFWAIILAFYLYNWLWKESQNRWLSLLISMAICYSSVMVDCVAYLSINSFIFGVILVCISTILFEKAFTARIAKKKSLKYLIVSVLCLYCSIHSYQLVLTTIFLLYAIKVWYSKERKKIVIQFWANIFLMVVVVGVYYASIILANNINGTVLNTRAQFISDIPQLIQKIQWFCLHVLPAAIDRIIVVFGGRAIISSKNYWYYLNYRSDISLEVIWLLRGIILLMVFGTIIMYLYRTHKILESLFLFLAIPASYGIYLLLLENGYLTYYAFPLISLLLFYIAMFIYEIIKIITNNRESIVCYIGTAIICWIGIQTYVYANDFWVQTNKESYDFLYHSLETNLCNQDNDVNWIHVYGTPNPEQNTAYSVFAVELICRELGIDYTDYRITSTNNFEYALTMPEGDMSIAEEKLDDLEIKKLKEFYSYDQTYNQYYWNYKAGIDEINEIRELFIKADLMPDKSDNAVIVDLTWVNGIWK